MENAGIALFAGGLGGLLLGGALLGTMDPDIVGIVISASCVAMFAGIPVGSIGMHKVKKATSLYNESLGRGRRGLSEVKVGLTGNGVGLAIAF